MDPLRELLERWEQERDVFARAGSDDLIALSQTHARELEDALARLSEARVPYRIAADLTGYALGSLKNMGLENVGSRGDPAFRLIDLPFKAGFAGPGKALLAASILHAKVGLRLPAGPGQGAGVTYDSHPIQS